MTLEGYWQGVRRALDEALAEAVPDLFGGIDAAGRDELRRTVSGGKRIRACLLCLVCDALGGERAGAVPRALAVECIHAASLIHDDFVDGDPLRREEPATWSVAGVRRAVLLADVLFSTAIERMAALGPAETRIAGRTIAAMAAGAYREQTLHERLASASRPAAADGYDAIIAAKTGSLFEAAASLGALAAGADAAQVAAAARFGAQLGRMYQLADDLAELEPAGPDAEPDLAGLLPAMLRFSGRARPQLLHWAADWSGEAGRSARPPAPVLAAVRANLRAAAVAAGGQARAQLTAFPPGRHRTLLDELLASALRAQVADLELGAS